ncbi:MAG: DUF4139 domain-containing protein [Deltaproteobacteria bacterium]|nr:MAG: DUF4139 domain-containing protein [Deltaproteobacteria bacterium]
MVSRLGAICWLACLVVFPPSLVAAEIVSTLGDQDEMAVTIYNDDLALVRDRRQVTLPQGEVSLALREVSARIRPETALLRSLSHPRDVTVFEQNFDFDLLTPGKLLEKYVGRDVQLVRTHPQTGVDQAETARVLAAGDGVVLKVGDRIETGLPGRLVFPDVPSHLRDRPTLVVDLASDRAAKQQLEVSYLTGGLGWQADYVAGLSGDEKTLDLSGWVTLTNQSGTTYRNARLQLVAGDVNRVRDELFLQRGTVMEQAMPKAAPAMAEESLFEYHLYTLSRPTTLKENQTKQVALLAATGVPLRKEYRLAGGSHYYQGRYAELGEKLKVAVFVEFDNKKATSLGLPLPKGVVRVYKQDRAGQPQFIGEDRIDHTPENETVRLKLGEAFDVTANRRQTDFRKLGGDSRYNYRFETAFEVVLKNAKDEAVTVTVAEPVPGDWKVLSASHPHRKGAANAVVWEIPVPARGEATLAYRVEVNY